MIGVGYWGPNLLRNFASLGDVAVAAICDADEKRADTVRKRFCPGARVVRSCQELAEDRQIDAIVLATPLPSHFELGRLFLAAGKHVFIEKPLAQTVEQCQALIDLAERRQKVLMVGHVFKFNAAVRRVKEYLDDGTLGELFYVYSQRVNLGRIQHDVNALWSFAPHDISIMRYWLGQDPLRVAARGLSYLNGGVEDVVFATLDYPGKVGVHLHLGWLDPRKIRQMTLVGSKKMLVYDDTSVDNKIQVYDKGVSRQETADAPGSFAHFQYQIRVGDLLIPSVPFDEPLQSECRHFIECIQSGRKPLTDGQDGLRVVRVLQAAEQSLKQDGRPIEL
jgi:predicted dehydrogenase